MMIEGRVVLVAVWEWLWEVFGRLTPVAAETVMVSIELGLLSVYVCQWWWWQPHKQQVCVSQSGCEIRVVATEAAVWQHVSERDGEAAAK